MVRITAEGKVVLVQLHPRLPLRSRSGHLLLSRRRHPQLLQHLNHRSLGILRHRRSRYAIVMDLVLNVRALKQQHRHLFRGKPRLEALERDCIIQLDSGPIIVRKLLIELV
jgi:hypothetical protein